MATDPIIVQYLESIKDTVNRIDEKVDGHATDIASLKESRAEIRGMARIAATLSVGTAGFVSWLASYLKH